MKITAEERTLLQRLARGELDGPVGDDFITDGGSSVWMSITDGIPVKRKQGPGGKFFNGKENERYIGKQQILKVWQSEDEKLEFLQKFGWLLIDNAARIYSARFKPKK